MLILLHLAELGCILFALVAVPTLTWDWVMARRRRRKGRR